MFSMTHLVRLDGLEPQTLHELTYLLRQLTPCLGRELQPQAWHRARRLRYARSSGAGGIHHRRFQDPHFWRRAQRARDSPKAEACAPKCAHRDSVPSLHHQLLTLERWPRVRLTVRGRPAAKLRSAPGLAPIAGR